ncbi:hypothetical protein SSPO_001030 [Streptomyces antimycoticus]|uniref:Regulatory protein n=1 Tax=Streptomyces antimycoticus TaxID=68175 RepID=A0A499UA07_9ACTN|nr:hypothetical protein [Streptomyces antimycoticus]BBJ37385.1 hypothetical protein SSPO_001030 [Streptomyces antimycoticus]
MVDTSADNTNLKSQYASQITADLERNSADHERLSSEITALQQQLLVLENNRALLLGMRQSLGDEAAGDVPGNAGVSGSENGASATRKSAERSAARKPRKKTDAARGKRKGTESGGSPTKRVREAGAPTLRALIHGDLTQHREPRSAAEVTAAITQALPDREIKATVVRSTLESLVAKGEAHRTKQQRSVLYSAAVPDAAAGAAEHSAASPS